MSRPFWPLVSLALALALGAVVLAQAPPAPALDGINVLSGGDIGFRVEYFEGKRPVGTLVVRVNGQWVEPKSAPALQLLTPTK
jgi:hypothetical protein